MFTIKTKASLRFHPVPWWTTDRYRLLPKICVISECVESSWNACRPSHFCALVPLTTFVHSS
jgi:hypothetical protein